MKSLGSKQHWVPINSIVQTKTNKQKHRHFCAPQKKESHTGVNSEGSDVIVKTKTIQIFILTEIKIKF